MLSVNPQSQVEVDFWKTLHSSKGDGYEEFRLSELEEKTRYFPSFKSVQGLGLDLGSGLVSVLERSGKKFIALDPLMDEYDKIFPLSNRKFTYVAQLEQDKIPFPDGHFDWVFCVNVIDHTPDPIKLIEEIWRVLKPGGMFFFEINFDDHISPAHYGLWNKELVNKILNSQTHLFAMINDISFRNPSYPQELYWAEYKRI